MKIIKFSLLAIACTFSFMLVGTIQEATAASNGSITISPFLKEIRFTANEPTKEFSVSLTNNTKITQEFSLNALDFGSLNETGGIVFAGSNSNSLINKYGLANWLTLGTQSITIEPGKTATIPVAIINDVSMKPGGHYAAIVASVRTPETSSSNVIGVNQKLSSLIFATKMGGEKYDLTLKDIDVSGGIFKLPSQVKLRFYNPGNVHIVPRGIVKIISPNGTVVSQGVINEESSYVLPETTRQLTVEMNDIGSVGLWPALYRVQVDYRYEGFETFARKEKTVYFMNLVSLVLILLVIGGGLYYALKVHHKTAKKSSKKAEY